MHDEDAERGPGPESASSKEVCRAEQPEGTDSLASSAATAEGGSHRVDQSCSQNRVGSHVTGVFSDSCSDSEPNQATAGACDGSQEVGISFSATGSGQSHDEGSVTDGLEFGAAEEEVSSSSIHSRLLNAARAAKVGRPPGEAHAALLMMMMMQMLLLLCLLLL